MWNEAVVQNTPLISNDEIYQKQDDGVPVLVSISHTLCGNPKESSCRLEDYWRFSVEISSLSLRSS